MLDMFGLDRKTFDRDRSLQGGQNLIRVVGFGQVGESSLHERANRVLNRRVPCQNDNRELRVQLHHRPQNGLPIQIW